MESKLETSIYLAVAEFHGRKAFGHVKHNEIATFEIARFTDEEDRGKILAMALEDALRVVTSSEEVIEICVNPQDVELARKALPEKWRDLVTSCSYNPAYQVAMEKLLGERP